MDKFQAEKKLINFIPLVWPVLEPSRPFVNGYHIGAVCDHLEAVTNNQIKRLLINVPPGFMKSLTTEVLWPAWEWGPKNLPSTRYVSASYSADLTIRDNMKMRRVIESDIYQEMWGERFNFTSDQNSKIKFQNNKTGFKLATSVRGLGTGERGDRFIIDDPHNVRDGESDIKRHDAILWFTETVPTRINDPELSAIIVIMQRVHESDVSGYILANDLGYEYLCLPMEYDPAIAKITSKFPSTIGFKDTRKKDGELLWPERFPAHIVAREKKILGSYAYAGQFQQQPSPRGGGMFKREWFKLVDECPVGGKTVRAWDLAATEGDSAPFTVGIKMKRMPNGEIYIMDVVRFRGSSAVVEQTIANVATQDGHGVLISIPQDPGQAGKSQKRWMASALAGYQVTFSPETGSKEVRAQALASQAEAGNVSIVVGTWNNILFDEMTKFPMSAFKDQVDALSRGMMELIKKSKMKVPDATPIKGYGG